MGNRILAVYRLAHSPLINQVLKVMLKRTGFLCMM